MSSFEQSFAAKVAGALAHEMNNPLQGLVSQLNLVTNELTENDALKSRVTALAGGVQRLTRVVSNFSAFYENLPRDPDVIPLCELRQALGQILHASGLAITEPVCEEATLVHCMTSEVLKLFPEVVLASASRNHALAWEIQSGDRYSYLRLLYVASAGEAIWKRFDEADGLWGLPVMLEEIARLADGRVELLWQGDIWCGTALVLKHV